MRSTHAHSHHANAGGKKASSSSSTVFDVLYDEYLPFRLYADYMLGTSEAKLARKFALPEHWIRERIEAMRLCIEKQIRLNLLDNAGASWSLKAAS